MENVKFVKAPTGVFQINKLLHPGFVFGYNADGFEAGVLGCLVKVITISEYFQMGQLGMPHTCKLPHFSDQ